MSWRVPAFGLLFAAGLAEGAAEYARRSPKIEQHVAGTNAITVHALIAVATVADRKLGTTG